MDALMRGKRQKTDIAPPPRESVAAGVPASDARAVDLYLDMLAAERGAAANTLEAYRRDLEDFAGDLAQHGGAIATAESDAIREYLGRLGARGFSAASVARRLSAVRQLYCFL